MKAKADQVREILARNPNATTAEIKAATGLCDRFIRRIKNRAQGNSPTPKTTSKATKAEPDKPGLTIEMGERDGVLTSNTFRITTAEQLLDVAKVDRTVWEVDRFTINKTEMTMREPATTIGGAGDKAVVSEGKNGEKSTLWTRGSNKPITEQMVHIKVWLKRKHPQVTGTELLLKRFERGAPALKIPAIRNHHLSNRRALEFCIMDPHVGLMCQQPEADLPWDVDRSAAAIMRSITDLERKAMSWGPFEQVFLPFGNDFTHVDNVQHMTTAGTAQPEAISWHRMYMHAENIAIEMIERMRRIGKEIYIYEIPGNHSRQSDFTLARLLRAYFHTDPNVHVDAGPSPYKFHRFGTSLIGYEHGHSVSPIRLAALMANECGKDYAETTYREWHLGDQHRKGSSNPAAFEEQSVSIEYIPGLVAPNEWHRIKAFNHQKRGAMAFVYDHDTGPIARLQYNIGRYDE